MSPASTLKLIAVDLDGTLLGSDMQVSEENLAAALRWRERGVLVVPTTGRTLCELPPCLLDAALFPYIIYSSGASITDRRQGRVDACGVDPLLCERALRVLAAVRGIVILHIDGATYVDAATYDRRYYEVDMRMGAGMAHMIYSTATPHPDLPALCRQAHTVEMVSIFFPDPTERALCRERLRALGVRVSSSGEGNLEFVADGASKGAALQRLCKTLGIDIADTVGIGDSQNDLSLLRAAGRGLAVANASDALKGCADDVICHNDEHILLFLEQYATNDKDACQK